jgi:cytochrome P450
MLAAEGHVHKRQRKVAAPTFSTSSLNNLRPLVFKKGMELRDKWLELVALQPQEKEITLDVCHWVSRATFDVIGVAGPYSSLPLSNPIVLYSHLFDPRSRL